MEWNLYEFIDKIYSLNLNELASTQFVAYLCYEFNTWFVDGDSFISMFLFNLNIFLGLDLSPYNLSNIDTLDFLLSTSHQKNDLIER